MKKIYINKKSSYLNINDVEDCTNMFEVCPDFETEAYVLEQAGFLFTDQTDKKLVPDQLDYNFLDSVATYNLKKESIKKDSCLKKVVALMLASYVLVISATSCVNYVDAKAHEFIRAELGDFNFDISYHNKQWGYLIDTNIVSDEIVMNNNNLYIAFARLYSVLKEYSDMGYKIFDEYQKIYTPESYLQIIYTKVNDILNFSIYESLEEYISATQHSKKVFELLEEDYFKYLKEVKEYEKAKIKNRILKKE